MPLFYAVKTILNVEISVYQELGYNLLIWGQITVNSLELNKKCSMYLFSLLKNGGVKQ